MKPRKAKLTKKQQAALYNSRKRRRVANSNKPTPTKTTR